MSVFINGASLISPQKTFDGACSSEEWIRHSGIRLTCVEPDYRELIDPKAIRRMSRIIRMGIAAGTKSVKEAGLSQPDAIITGTAFGCLEDTHSFISRMTEYGEDMLNPTPFIHSTHNTIAGQLALHFKCYGYNSTYVHRSLSFESALLDGMMQIEEGDIRNALIGGTDELIDASYDIMNRLGFYRKNAESNAESLFQTSEKGTIAGEGAGYFLISSEKNERSLAEIESVHQISFVKPNEAAALLSENSIGTFDLVISGHNGDTSNDQLTDEILNSVAPGVEIMKYKHLCGDYPTSIAFALWIATQMLSGKLNNQGFKSLLSSEKKLDRILIMNQTSGIHYSFITVKAC